MKKLNLFETIRIRSAARYQPVKTGCFGFPFTMVDKSSFLYMHDEIFVKEIYRFVSAKRSPLIIDCGANIGVSLIYFKKLYPGARLIAFEPDPKIFETLAGNVKASGYADIELVNKGLSDKDGTMSFFAEGSDGGRLATRDDKNNLIEVKTVRLSEFLSEEVDLLKIDIEGSEFKVLTECAHRLGNVRELFIEYHSLHDAPQNLAGLLSILEATGFRYYIQSVGIASANPFMEIKTYLGYDLQLNIFAYRDKQ